VLSKYQWCRRKAAPPMIEASGDRGLWSALLLG
jgi:hypothetical protein